MDFVPENHSSEENEAFVAKYIEAADKAAGENHKRLAIHLYIAAFEQENLKRTIPSDPVLVGMGNAWDIACEIGDKSSAETIFTELSPYSSPEQVKIRVGQLQEMAMSQLQEMGVPRDRISRMHPIHTPSATAAGADPGFFEKLQDVIHTDPQAAGQQIAGVQADGMQSADMQAGHEVPGDVSMDGEPDEDDMSPAELLKHLGGGMVDDGYQAKKYSDLVGYDSELKQMCVYGFESAGDQEYRRFIKETSEFHGVDGISLYEPFLMNGPSRDDLYEFAEATAGEIGNPVVSLHVRTDDEGMWTMRLSGPFRRGLFGVSDPTDVPMPCTFIIENIDLLQEFIRASLHSEAMGYEVEEAHPSHGRGPRGYGEILGYVHSMMSKPQVFAIATAASEISFLPQLDDLFSQVQKIQVAYPTVDERKAIWENFAADHASFSMIDLDALAEISAGISRHDLVAAGRNAVRDAYQKSISNSDYEFVTLEDVLYELVPFVSDSKLGSAIEDAAAMAFSSELDGMLFETAGGEADGASAAYNGDVDGSDADDDGADGSR